MFFVNRNVNWTSLTSHSAVATVGSTTDRTEDKHSIKWFCVKKNTLLRCLLTQDRIMMG